MSTAEQIELIAKLMKEKTVLEAKLEVIAKELRYLVNKR
jgi:hypothetical protein